MKKNKANYLDNIPVIRGDIVWKEYNGLVTVNQEHKGFYAKIAQKVFKTPKTSYVDLDAFGSFVWLQIDGKRSIYEIGKLVKEEYGEAAEPLYERLSKYFYTLKDVDFVAFKKKVD